MEQKNNKKDNEKGNWKGRESIRRDSEGYTRVSIGLEEKNKKTNEKEKGKGRDSIRPRNIDLFSPVRRNYNEAEEMTFKKFLLLANFRFTTEQRLQYYLTATSARLSIMNHPGYYSNLLSSFPPELHCNDENKIDKDIYRTYPKNPSFTIENNDIKLKNILLAFSRRNCSIGYTQGLNFIAGRLLQVSSTEEEAFWLFTHLMEDVLPMNYFVNIYGITIDNGIISSIMHEKFPAVFEHLEEHSCDYVLDSLVNKWLLCLFVLNINEKVSWIIWDLMMIDKTIMIKAALALVNILSEEIMKINLDNDDVFIVINDMVRTLDYEERFLKEMNKIEKYIDMETLMLWREEEEIKRRQGKATPGQGRNVIECNDKKCDIQWNVCEYNTEYRNDHHKEYLFHRVYGDTNIIDDYVLKDSIGIDENVTEKNEENISCNDVLIERIEHKCTNEDFINMISNDNRD